MAPGVSGFGGGSSTGATSWRRATSRQGSLLQHFVDSKIEARICIICFHPLGWLVSTLIWSAYDSKDSFVSILLSVLLTGWFWNIFWNIFLEVLSFWKPKLLSYLIHRYGRSFFPTISKSLAMLLEDPVFWAMAFWSFKISVFFCFPRRQTVGHVHGFVEYPHVKWQ